MFRRLLCRDERFEVPDRLADPLQRGLVRGRLSRRPGSSAEFGENVEGSIYHGQTIPVHVGQRSDAHREISGRNARRRYVFALTGDVRIFVDRLTWV
ncbi:hypothetical protein EV650_3166 [Kribbella kalugense]|uniref:Uncharacterized protein n=1 Tax=Kribbella kalugense TaxID=2512221 RepID=A0A4R8A1K1_9ACTN|nr:hypothetical protein EV650_3166 [Kribbella kalugense]